MTVTGTEAPAERDTRFCGGPKRQSEGTCTRPAGWGTGHVGVGRCKLHGGSTPTHEAAGARALAEHAVEAARRTYGIPVDVEPGEALLGLVRTGAGVVAWLGLQVAELERVTAGADKPHPLVSLYLDERKHLAQVAKDTLAAGVAERRVRLEEEQGKLLVGLLERVIRRMDELVFEQTGRRLLDPMDPRVRELVRLELAAIDSPEAVSA